MTNQAEKPSDRKPTILIIDDIEPIVRTMRDGLAAFDNRVLTALSGAEGLKIFRENRVDIIICDLGMPEMNGWQVGRTIRQECIEKGIPKPHFILLSGWSSQIQDKQKILESGVDSLLGKPIDLVSILKVIREIGELGA
ncbi:response regulator [Thermodesulfobacteriota bacterium]